MDLHKLEDLPPWEWPDSTAMDLLGILKNGRAAASDRLLAAELAGDYTVINDDLAAVLLTIVSNSGEPDELRGAAAIAFGAALEGAVTFEFDDPEEVPISEEMFEEIQPTLRALFGDAGVPKLVRRRILEAAVRAPQEWQTDAIRTAWSSGDDEWKLTAAFGMAHIPGFAAEIVEALESKDPDIFYEAVGAAGVWEIDAAWPYVVAILEDDESDKELLLTAFEAAVTIRPDEARDLLMDYLDSTDEEVAEAARSALMLANGLIDPDMDEDDEDEEDEDDPPR